MALFLSLQSFAQDGLDFDVDLGGNDTPGLFLSPIFWVGIAVFIIILAIIFNGGKK
ncbi:MAG: hypothetical protein ACI9P5_003882 [Saprospiraceae bacterium]|jgi:hypothetical protein